MVLLVVLSDVYLKGPVAVRSQHAGSFLVSCTVQLGCLCISRSMRHITGRRIVAACAGTDWAHFKIVSPAPRAVTGTSALF
eukprot:6190085-Pleurochrysis_carterae.AAC.2